MWVPAGGLWSSGIVDSSSVSSDAFSAKVVQHNVKSVPLGDVDL